MPSSHNLFKHSNVIEKRDIRKIETTYVPKKKSLPIDKNIGNDMLSLEGLEDNPYSSLMISNLEKELEALKKKYQIVIKKERDKFFHELKRIRATVEEATELEAERIKEEAYDSGLKEGRLDGFEVGKKEGFQVGIEEAGYLKDNALEIIKSTKEQVEQYKKEKQNEFIELASIMAEKVVNEELSTDEVSLRKIIAPVLNRLDKEDNFITVFVTKDNYESTLKYMEELKQTSEQMKYTVLVDESLKLNGCVIETDYEVIDLDIKKQLELMVKDLSEGECDV